MKRRLMKLGVLLVVGAMINVAVACGCAAFSTPWGAHVKVTRGWYKLDTPVVQNGKEIDAFIERTQGFGTTQMRSFTGWSKRSEPEASQIQPYWFDKRWTKDDWNSNRLNMTAHGWPLRSIAYRWSVGARLGSNGKPTPAQVTFVRGIRLSDFDRSNPSLNLLRVQAMPLEPIWTGFAVNTLFYAAMVWLMLFAPFRLRRWRRMRRGLCGKCGYDLRGSAHEVCPECGAATQHGNSPGGARG